MYTMDNTYNTYIYVSSSDFSDIYPANQPNNFTTVLPQALHLQGIWSLCLLDINIKSKSLSPVFVVCNIVDYSTVGKQLHRILRRVTVTGDKETYTSTLPQYVTVDNTVDIQTIKITILDCDTMLPALLLPLEEKVTCTLHLKRDRPPLLF